MAGPLIVLRKLLGEGYIETVPRRGYRFARAVSAPAIAPAVRPKGRTIAMAVAVIAAAVLLLLLRRDDRALPRSIAVLPFKPLVAGSGDPYLQLGMADALITELSNIREIRVRPTSSVLAYSGATDVAEVGRTLGVEAVLDGRIQRAGDRVRVTAQLVRVDDGTPLWAGKFDEELRNILAVQDAISSRIVSALTLDLTGVERASLDRATTRNAEAYQLYLRGRYHWYRWTPEEWLKAQSYFEQAVALDPQFALAWVGLGDSIAVQNFFRPPKEVMPRAKEAMLRALALDESLPDVHAGLGATAMFYDWDRGTAEREIRRAIELNPNHALSHDLHALLLASGGRFDAALDESRRARDLDPTSPYMNTDLATIHYYKREYDKALQQVRVALAIDPSYVDGLRYLAAIEEQRQNYPAALDASARLLALTGDADTAAAMRRAPDYQAALRAWLQSLMSKTSYVPPLEIAELHARLGEREQALTWLEKALADRSPGLIWLNVEPRWDAYRDDPRFRNVVAAVFIAPASR